MPGLTAVYIGASEVIPASEFLAEVTGSSALTEGDVARIPIGDISLIVHPLDGTGTAGITGIGVFADNALKPARLNGLKVVPAAKVSAQVPADVRLDHVALVVADLSESVEAWTKTVGIQPEFVGSHPISAGTFNVARFLLGDQMIELLAPESGKQSAIQQRLERAGEGPLALALPADNLAAKRQELETSGVQLVWNDPHWVVHPNNPAKILIQLTPRVEH